MRVAGKIYSSVILESQWAAFVRATQGFSELACWQLCLLTGSHSVLLKAAVTAVAAGKVSWQEQESTEQIVRKLLSEGIVYSKCKQLWLSLGEVEQACLKEMHQGRVFIHKLSVPYAGKAVREACQALLLKGIWHETAGVYECFSVLFAAFVARQQTSDIYGMQLNPVSRIVYIDGCQLIKRLSKKESKLLEFLASEPGRVFQREETTRAVYGLEGASTSSDDDRLNALVERTRRHIGDTQRNSRFLETVRGVGHRLKGFIGMKG